jgi:hypothetical protein
MSTEIESLNLQITSNSASAVAGIDALAQSLEKLKGATQGGVGLTSITKSMGTLSSAAKGFDANSVANVDGLAKAIQLLNGVKVSTSIGNQITAISSALKSADFTGGAGKMQELVAALAPLSNLGKNNLSSFVTSLKNIPKVFAELNKIDMTAFAAKIQAIATSLKPLGDEMQKVANGFSAFPAKIQKVLNATNQIPNTNKKAATSFTDFYHKLRIGIRIFKQVGNAIYSAIKKSSEYNEVVNLFSVSLGQYAIEAGEYAESVSDIMGIDPSEWMRNQGVFMTLATGFGVAGDRAYKMSQQLTQLGYDISSFQNISVEEAMKKLQSGLSGELEPLRRIGYDLSQAKLEATALALGIDKSVSSMTQAEKAQLRYYAIMTQVTQQQGDMARTLNEPANQMRVFKAQVQVAAREIGSVFIPALQAILPYATAVAKVIGTLASVIAGLFGYEKPIIEDKGIEPVVSATENIEESLEGAKDEAKKLKSYMLGFDELNVINPDTGASAEDASGAFDFELPEYDFLKDLEESKVAVIVEEMKEWLGITGEITSWADLFDTKLGHILVTVGLIGAGFGAWRIGTFVVGLVTSLGQLTGISTLISGISAALAGLSAPVVATFAAILAAVLAVVAGLAAVYATNEEVRTTVNGLLVEIGDAFVPLLTFITDTVIPDLKSAWDRLLEMLEPLGDWLVTVFTSIWTDMIIPALDYLAHTIIPDVISTVERLWNEVLVPFGGFVGDVLTPVIQMLSDVLTWLWQYVVLPIADFLGGVFKAAWEGLVKIMNQTVIPAVNKIINVLTFLWNKVLSPIISFMWDVFTPAFENVFISIKEVIGNIKKVFVGIIDFVVGIFTSDWGQAWRGIVDIFSGIWGALSTAVKAPINFMLGMIEGFVNKIIDGWNWLKEQINSLSIEIPEWLGGGTLGFNLSMSSHVDIPRFAEGGFPETGQMFIAREAGAEMVGNIGRRTAVANNDQIVSGIAGGVAEANEEQNALLREQNSLLRAILEKDSGVYLDGKNLTNSVEKYQRERGRVLISGGVV